MAQARAARRAGADIVIVKYHGGSEYDAMPNAEQIALGRALTASPYVDLVAGEHAHVVQPITKVNGKWVVYGLGNAIGQSETSRPRAYEGITVVLGSARRFTGLRGRPCGVRADVLEPLLVRTSLSASSGWCGRWRAESGTRRGCARLGSPREQPFDLLGHARGLEER